MNRNEEQDHLREHAVLLGDVVQFFRAKKRVLLLTSLITGGIFALLSLLMPITYEVKGSFKNGQGSGNNFSLGSNALSMFLQGPQTNNSFAALMKSRMLLKKVIARSGIQISEELMPLPLRVLKRIRRNLSSSFNKRVAWAPNVVFQDVTYNEEYSSHFLFKGIDAETFLIRTGNGTEFQGRVGDPIHFDTISLTVALIPKSRVGAWKKYYIEPGRFFIEGLQGSLQAKSSLDDSSIIDIKIKDGLPQRAISIVNAAMKTYKAYLVAESERITSEHLESLYAHKDAVTKRVERDFHKYADKQRKNAEEVGFLDDKAELQYLYGKERALVEKIAIIYQMLEALEKGLPNGSPSFAFRERLMLEEEEIRFKQNILNVDVSTENVAIASLDENTLAISDPLLRRYLHKKIKDRWPYLATKSIIPVVDRVLSFQGAELHPFSKNVSHHDLPYSVLHPEALNTYLVSLLGEVQTVHRIQEGLSLARRKLQAPLFDLKSIKVLAGELELPSIVNVDELLFKTADVAHYSEKERAQVEKRTEFLKSVLIKSLDEKESLLRQKEQSLLGEIKKVNHALYYQFEQKIRSLKEYRRNIEQEMKKQLFVQREEEMERLQKIKGRLKKMPEKWVENTKLQLSTDVDKNLMQHLLQFIESKNLENKLSTIEARPLDEAYCLKSVKKSSMIVFGVGGLAAGGFLGFTTLFLLGLIRGLPISGANARFKGYRYLGHITSGEEITALNENELEVLRGIVSVCGGKITALMQGHGPSYAPHIAKLLGYQGQKVLLIDFEQRIEFGSHQKGLFEYLQGEIETLPILHKEQYAYLPFGRRKEFSNEQLRSHMFKALLEALQSEYERILLVTKAPLFSDEVMSCISYSTNVVLSFHAEGWEEIRDVRVSAKEQKITLHFLEY